jgi:hypothetical protein
MVIVGVIACGAVRPELEATQLRRLTRLGTPTGREPRLIWTPERQAVWSQMRADFDANPLNPPTLGGRYFKLIKENAECGCRYGDSGLWATLMFQMTGDRRYVDLAWKALEGRLLRFTGRALGGNFAREYAAESVLLYDWLYPGLSSAQRQTLLSKLNEMFDEALTNSFNPNAPVRTADSDQTVGVYFGLAFLFVATGDHNARANEFFHRPYVGGLAATGRDRSTLRNAILDYVGMAEGGEWIEGSDYNLGTVRLLLLGSEGLRTATGKEYFPEIARWLSSAVLRPAHVITPDLKQSYQWGDTEHPGVFQGRLAAWQTTNGILAGLGDASTAPYLQDLIGRLVTRYGAVGYQSAEPMARMFLTFNPYAETAPITSLPRTWFASGQGLMIVRSGWDEHASMFGAHVPRQQRNVDHQVSYMGDFQLYRRGSWALTHPLSYGGPPLLGEGTNSMLHAGFGSMTEFKDVVGMELDPEGRFAYLAGTTGGQKYPQGSYVPPPTYLHEWTRSLLYVPAENGLSDTVVVFDRSQAEHPRDLPRLDRYSAADRDTIATATSLRQWLIHMPVRPSLSASEIAWDVASGDRVRVTMLLPRRRIVTPVDQTQIWTNNNMPPAQRKWHVRVAPESEQPWETFLNVIDVGSPDAMTTAQLVTSPDDHVQGAVLRRRGNVDVVALFNATPGRSSGLGNYDPRLGDVLREVRLRRTGFTVQWTSSTQTTDVLIADLDASRSWQYRIDAEPARPIVISDGRITRLQVQAAGVHTLAIF